MSDLLVAVPSGALTTDKISCSVTAEDRNGVVNSLYVCKPITTDSADGCYVPVGSRTVKSTLGSRKFPYLATSQAHIRWGFGVRFFLVTLWNDVLGACEVALQVEGSYCKVRGRFYFVL